MVWPDGACCPLAHRSHRQLSAFAATTTGAQPPPPVGVSRARTMLFWRWNPRLHLLVILYEIYLIVIVIYTVWYLKSSFYMGLPFFHLIDIPDVFDWAEANQLEIPSFFYVMMIVIVKAHALVLHYDNSCIWVLLHRWLFTISKMILRVRLKLIQLLLNSCKTDLRWTRVVHLAYVLWTQLTDFDWNKTLDRKLQVCFIRWVLK